MTLPSRYAHHVARWALAILVASGSHPAIAQTVPAAHSAHVAREAHDSLPAPAAGAKIRVSALSLPPLDARLTGAFLGVDSTTGVRTLGIEAHDGVHYIPCSAVDLVEVQSVRRFPLWQKVGWTLVGAWAGLYLGHMVADNPSGSFTYEDPPLPHPDREHAAHRRENRIMIGGTVLGASAAYLAIRDTHRWRPAPLEGCRKPEYALARRVAQSSQ